MRALTEISTQKAETFVRIGETADVKSAKSLLVWLFPVYVALASPSLGARPHFIGCQSAPLPVPSPDVTPAPAPQGPRDSDENRADMDVAGTLAHVAPGGKMAVEVWAKNRGTATWTPRGTRIIVRWIDFSTGTRRRWSYNWIKVTVAPLAQFRQSLDVPVPPRAGRYKVVYGLVRVGSDGKAGAPPAYDAPQNVWPGEFAAVAFSVNVG